MKHTFNVDEVYSNNKLIHQEILNTITHLKETDGILYDELGCTFCTNDSTTMHSYITQHINRSGLEVWRTMHVNHEPKSFQRTEALRKQIEGYARTRCHNYQALQERMDELNAGFIKYRDRAGVEYPEERQLHHLADIMPQELWDNMVITCPRGDWTVAVTQQI